jgi:multisubunit Na+/H+ antiporter MnhF subunit
VNAFTIAGTALIVGLVPLGILAVVGREIDGVVALEVCGTLATLILLCLGEGFHRSAYFDLPVICVACTWIGGMVFARFFGRWI